MKDEELGQKWKYCVKQGEFEKAWEINDIIFKNYRQKYSKEKPRHFQIIWNGSSLENKKVLIRCYHGLGDTIQFARFVPLAEAAASKLFVWVQPELIRLLQTMESSAEFLPISDGSPPVEYDIDAELMELPYVLRININNPIIEIPYLRVKAREYIERGRLKAGIAWKSGDWDARRSIPYEKMKLLNKVEGVDFHILQKGKGLSEWTDNFGFLSGSEDIYEAAEIVKSLDVVITADTMIAHLAGALGVRVWLLLCDDPDWRWFENRSDSPWYPTMRIFRQKKAGEWDKVIAEVAQELSIMQKKASKFC